jgi:23S rRNA pseudouridine2605 synthase
MLEDGPASPAVVRKINAGIYNYSIVIHEGRKHQVRRMFEALGYKVKALKRVRMGNLHLGTLREGKVRVLRRDEVEGLG